MSLFTAKLKVGNMALPGREQEPELLVGTGAAYSFIARQRLEQLGTHATGRMKFKTIEGHVIERDMALVPLTVALAL